MAICLTNGDGKDFFCFIGSSWQDGFLGGPEKLDYLYHNFAMSNIVVELFW